MIINSKLKKLKTKHIIQPKNINVLNKIISKSLRFYFSKNNYYIKIIIKVIHNIQSCSYSNITIIFLRIIQ